LLFQGRCCWRENKTRILIEINKATLGEVSGHEVYLTLLHELAHALAGPGVHHTAPWRRHCYRVGGLPERCCKRPQLTKPARLTCNRRLDEHIVSKAFRAKPDWKSRVGQRCGVAGCDGCLVIARRPAPVAAKR
jgi:predicted SprT family Zn-dependent metalloprotease